MNKKWHENIPENGVLCEDDNGNLVKIVPCDKDGDDYYALNDDEDCISSCRDGYHHDDLTPLTSEEIWQFMPWQDIDSAPRVGEFLVQTKLFEIVTVYYSKNGVLRRKHCGNVMLEKDCIGWLPLPQVQS